MTIADLSPFQNGLLEDLEPGVWYDVHETDTGAPELPAWFYRKQTQAMATITPMVEKRALEIRFVTDLELPQVRRAG